MIEDIAGGLIRFLVSILKQIYIELILELLIKGPGYFIVKMITNTPPDPDGYLVVISGILFWVVIIGGILVMM